MDTGKISFGFKPSKKPNILPTKPAKEQSKVELIKCLEGKEIKLVAEKQDVAPLVIQMQSSQKTSAALASLIKRRAVLLNEDEPEEPAMEEAQSIAEVTGSLEQRAARELLAAAQTNGSDNVTNEKLVLPVLKADELPLDGAKESNLDDYDSIPIQQFGLAMLRGMGWVDPPPKKKGAPIDEAPVLWPKGMGLGADKALKPKPLLVQPEPNEVLEIKKQAFVRILGGKQKDQYGQIEGFDDHGSRIIVKMAIGGAKEAFNEFLCQPVSKKEFAQFSKCINTAKYTEYKKMENEHGQIILKPSEVKTERRDKQEERRGEDRKPRREASDERKPYKEQYEVKTEDRKPRREAEERKAYKDMDSYKSEEPKPYKELSEVKTERREKEEERRGEDRKDRAYKDTEMSYKSDRKPYKEESRYQDTRGDSSTSKASRNSRRSRSHSPRPRSKPPTNSSSSRRPPSSCDEAEDTGDSTESDSDSAYERKHKKKSSSAKSKKKKSKKPKGKSSRRRHDSDSNSEDSDDSAEERSRRKNKHKKKTKKSKHARSRSRSKSRDRGRAR